MSKPIKTFKDFKRQVAALPQEKQIKVLTKAFDLIYDQLDEGVWRTMATAVKHAKDSQLEGHEKFQIQDKDLKKLTHIQDGFRRQKKE